LNAIRDLRDGDLPEVAGSWRELPPDAMHRGYLKELRA
jgi:hypothetical protein